MARILTENILEDATVFLSSQSADTGEENLLDWRTFTLFEADIVGAIYLEATMAAPVAADCLGICHHNLGTLGIEVSIEYSDDDSSGSSWSVALAGFTPNDDRTIMRSFTSVTAQHWRIKLDAGSGSATQSLYMGVMALGEALTFPRGVQVGFDPTAEQVISESVVSQTGHLLGSLVRFHQRSAQFTISWYDASWWKANFLPVWYQHIRHLKPFFFLWSESLDDSSYSFAELMRLDPQYAVLDLAYALTFRRLNLALVGMSNIPTPS